MQPQLIDELLTALKPAIRSQRKARKLLEAYWADKWPLIWTTQDVHRAANEKEMVLTEDQARHVLEELCRHHNKQYGLQWRDFTGYIRDNVLGRPITKRELDRFIHQDTIAIEKKQASK